MARIYKEQMARPDFTFVTEANSSEVSKEVAERRAACQHKWEVIPIPGVGSHPPTSRTVCEYCFIDKQALDEALAQVEKEKAQKQ